jgi:hypothetical protein
MTTMARHKIPKRIAGVKVNKKLRKRGNELLAMADSPEGREKIAMGLSMAAAAASVALRKRSEQAAAAAPHAPDAPQPPEPPGPPEPPVRPKPMHADTPPIDPDKIVAAVGQTIEAAMNRFFTGLQKH